MWWWATGNHPLDHLVHSSQPSLLILPPLPLQLMLWCSKLLGKIRARTVVQIAQSNYTNVPRTALLIAVAEQQLLISSAAGWF